MNGVTEQLAEMRKSIEDAIAEKEGQLDEIQAQLADLHRHIAAFNAFDAAHNPQPTQRSRRETSEDRAPRGLREQQILGELERAGPASRGVIIEALGLKGDKTGEASVSNCLVRLIKQGKLARVDGAYYLPEAQVATEAAA